MTPQHAYRTVLQSWGFSVISGTAILAILGVIINATQAYPEDEELLGMAMLITLGCALLGSLPYLLAQFFAIWLHQRDGQHMYMERPTLQAYHWAFSILTYIGFVLYANGSEAIVLGAIPILLYACTGSFWMAILSKRYVNQAPAEEQLENQFNTQNT